MYKKIKVVALASAFALSSVCFADGEIVFCNSFDDQFNPENPGTEFASTQISWFAKFDEPLGVPSVVVSLYQNQNETNQQLILREPMQVNPRWNAIGFRNTLFPSEGSYEVAINCEDGTPLANGMVKLVKASDEDAVEVEPKKEEKVGTSLEDLFNRYAPK